MPRAYQGTVSGTHVFGDGGASNGWTETWTATGVRLERVVGSPDAAPSYHLTAGSVQWSMNGTFPGPCTMSASRTFSLSGDSYDQGSPPSGQIDFSPGTATYSAFGSYSKLVQDVPQQCPDGNTTVPFTPYPTWLHSRGERPRPADWTLSGSATASDSNSSASWQWSFTPEF